MKKELIVNTLVMIGKNLSEVGNEISKVMEVTGEKPTYVVFDLKQHEELLSRDSDIKTKKGRILKFKGMSVMITL